MEENNYSLSASVCCRELRSNRKILEMHVSNCEADSIPHIKPKLLFLMTSPFLTNRISKILRQQTCVCLFFLPLLQVTLPPRTALVSMRTFLNHLGGTVILKPQVFKHDLYVLYSVQFVTF